MNLFRSEEHIARWLGGRGPGAAEGGSVLSPGVGGFAAGASSSGATITVAKLAELAFAWWDDRISADWRPHTREQNQAILERLGLTGEFWRLA
ncbi:MAG: hypothetical protein ACXVQZ_00250 [Gaiellaceae bacterium]